MCEARDCVIEMFALAEELIVSMCEARDCYWDVRFGGELIIVKLVCDLEEGKKAL